MKQSVFFIYQLSLALWVGGMACFAFLVTPQLFGQLGRDQAAQIVGFLFPLYDPILFTLSLIALASYLLHRATAYSRLVLGLLVVACLINAVQWLVILPQAADLVAQIGSFELTPKTNPLRQSFTKLHILGNVLGLLVLIDGLALLWFTGRDK